MCRFTSSLFQWIKAVLCNQVTGLPWTVSLMSSLIFLSACFPHGKRLQEKQGILNFFKDPKPVRKLWIKFRMGKKSHWLILLTIAVLSTRSSPTNLKLSMPSPPPLNDWLLDFDWQALEGPTGTTPCHCLYSGCLNQPADRVNTFLS